MKEPRFVAMTPRQKAVERLASAMCDLDDFDTAIDRLDNAIECGVENWTEVREALATLRRVAAQLRGGE